MLTCVLQPDKLKGNSFCDGVFMLVDTVSMAAMKRKTLEVIVLTTIWMLWNYSKFQSSKVKRNNILKGLLLILFFGFLIGMLEVALIGPYG